MIEKLKLHVKNLVVCKLALTNTSYEIEAFKNACFFLINITCIIVHVC